MAVAEVPDDMAVQEMEEDVPTFHEIECLQQNGISMADSESHRVRSHPPCSEPQKSSAAHPHTPNRGCRSVPPSIVRRIAVRAEEHPIEGLDSPWRFTPRR